MLDTSYLQLTPKNFPTLLLSPKWIYHQSRNSNINVAMVLLQCSAIIREMYKNRNVCHISAAFL